MSDSSVPQDAIVLSGAGANAAYEVGVMKALLCEKWGKQEDAPITPYCYSGTSVGALNATVMAAHSDMSASDAVKLLEKMWRKKIPGSGAENGMFRVRGMQLLNPSKYSPNPWKGPIELGSDFLEMAQALARCSGEAVASRKGLLDSSITLFDLSQTMDLKPLRDLVKKFVDVEKVAASSCKLRINAVNWETGSPETFENHDFAKGEGHQRVLGALAIPAFIPPQTVGGYPYVDGSVLMDTPLAPAIKARKFNGPVVLHTVYLDTDHADVPNAPVPNTFGTIYRLCMLALSRAVNSDLAKADVVNERLRTRRLLESLTDVDGTDDLFMTISKKISPEAARFWRQLTKDTQDKVSVTVHRYNPTKHIHGFEIAQFQKKKIKLLIDAGYNDALEHDCEKSGCILAR